MIKNEYHKSKDPNFKRGYPNRLYYVYWRIKQQCYNMKDRIYSNYGKKGIKMSPEFFNNFDTFVKHLLSIGYNPSKNIKEQVISRIDYSKDFEKGNMRIETPQERGNTRQNKIKIIYHGEKYTAYKLANKLNISLSLLYRKIKLKISLDSNPVNGYLFRGKLRTIKQISKKYNIKESTLRGRLKYKIDLDRMLWGAYTGDTRAFIRKMAILLFKIDYDKWCILFLKESKNIKGNKSPVDTLKDLIYFMQEDNILLSINNKDLLPNKKWLTNRNNQLKEYLLIIRSILTFYEIERRKN